MICGNNAVSHYRHTVVRSLLVAAIVFGTGVGRWHAVEAATTPTLRKLAPGALLEDSKAVIPQGFELRPVYARGLELTKVSEGWIPHLYNDSARYCTIGYGHLVKKAPCDGSEPVEFRRGLSKQQGTDLLIADMATSQYTVATLVTAKLSDGQYAALVDFVFNVGSANFRKSSLLKAVNSGQIDRVPGQFRRWVLAGGKPWPGLRKRREREIDLFFDGIPKPRAAPREDLPVIDIRRGE